MAHKITIICDMCETEFMIDLEMDLPPYWLGVQIAVANQDGIVPTKDMFIHVCSQECFIEFAKSQDLKEWRMLADKPDILEGEEE